MLKITVPASENWDPVAEEFVYTNEFSLTLEHSLISMSKWEAKYCKPFLSDKPMTDDELIEYIKCMTLTQNVNPDLYKCLPVDILKQITDYIGNPMTATTFSENQKSSGSSKKEIVTSELIYYWMVALNIPFECEKWHLNRLLTLIRVCNIKNSPSKKMSKSDILAKNKSLNAARRAKMHSRG